MANFTGRFGARRDRLYWSTPISPSDRGRDGRVPLVVLDQIPLENSDPDPREVAPPISADSTESQPGHPSARTRDFFSRRTSRLGRIRNSRPRSGTQFTAAAAA